MKRMVVLSILVVAFILILLSFVKVRTSASYSGVALGLWLAFLINNVKSFQNNYKPFIFSMFYLIYSIGVVYITYTGTWQSTIHLNSPFSIVVILCISTLVLVTISFKTSKKFIRSIIFLIKNM